MKIALTVWGNRISPLFDSADTLLVAEIDKKRISKIAYINIEPDSADFQETLKKSGIAVVICGAISRMCAERIKGSGINLFPFVTGKTRDVLEVYLTEKSMPPAFLMPGISSRGGNANLKRIETVVRRRSNHGQLNKMQKNSSSEEK